MQQFGTGIFIHKQLAQYSTQKHLAGYNAAFYDLGPYTNAKLLYVWGKFVTKLLAIETL